MKETKAKSTKKKAHYARMATDSRLLSAATVQRFDSLDVKNEIDTIDLYESIADENRVVKKGNLGSVETMLFSQATALDSVFHALLHRASMNMGEYPQAFERYMKLGLKAQSQCRTTLEALAEIKQPKSVTIAKQANIADQQVVNNGTMNAGEGSPTSPTRGKKKQKSENELLEQVEHDSVDTRAPGTTIEVNQEAETVEAVNRA